MTSTAADIMSRNVISVAPDAGVPEIAAILGKHDISAVPVIDFNGRLVGMISERDLLSPFSSSNKARCAWWLEMLAEGEALAPEFIQYASLDRHAAMDLMNRQLVTAKEDTPVAEIAEMLLKHGIKRVPILRDGHVVGIVSRADIVRALCAHPAEQG